MPYTRPYAGGFVNYPTTTTPIDATALNTMDVGIKTANDQFQTVTTVQRTALSPTVGQAVWDSDLRQLMVFMNASGGNAWQPVGNTIVCASTTRPSVPFEGQEIYETDTNQKLIYNGSSWNVVSDLDNIGGLSNDAYWMSMRKNLIINGAFAIDQRNNGAAQTITSGAALAYTSDRWYAYATGASVTSQRIAGAIPFRYYHRFTGAASNTLVGFGTRLEAADTFFLAGTTATLSAYIDSSSLTSITWTAYYANTTDTFGTIASPTRTQIATGSFVVSSTLAAKSVQISIPAAATTGIEIVFTTGALLATQTLTFAGVQFEQNTTATALERRPLQQELALCQRFYTVIASANAAAQPIAMATAYNTSNIFCSILLPNVMRAAPVTDATTGTNYFAFYINPSTPVGFTTLAQSGNTSASVAELIGSGATFTGGSSGFVRTNNASARVALVAEL